MFIDPDGMEAEGIKYSNGYSTSDSRDETGAVSHEGTFQNAGGGESGGKDNSKTNDDDKPKGKKTPEVKPDAKKSSSVNEYTPCCRVRHHAKKGTIWYRLESFFAVQGLMMIPAAAIEEGAAIGAAAISENVVYHSIEEGATVYVGITNNLARRAAEHLAGKGINIQPLLQGLTRSDARAVEQALIQINGLGKNGGTLLNKINSISTSNPTYANQLEKGYELLKSIGYQ